MLIPWQWGIGYHGIPKKDYFEGYRSFSKEAFTWSISERLNNSPNEEIALNGKVWANKKTAWSLQLLGLQKENPAIIIFVWIF